MRARWCLCLLVVAACNEPASPPGSSRGALKPAERVLPWGEGPGQVGLRPGRPERPAQGPSAVAAGPGGAVLVLDRLNQRVLRLVPGEVQLLVAGVPEHAMDLAAGPDGALAAHSPLRARVWVYAPGGAPAGSLAVDRIFRQVQRVGLGASLQVTLHNAHQDTFVLGSPGAPQLLETVLHSVREGAFLLPHRDNAGVAVRLDRDRPEVLVLSNIAGERSRVRRRRLLADAVLAARLVGTVGDAACLLLERRRPSRGAAIEVDRAAVCLDLLSGRELLRAALPPPGLYLPRRELAVGGAPARRVLIHPRSDGLLVRTWPRPRAGGGAR